MMSSTVFDALEYVHRLKEVGIPEQQAEAHAYALAEVVENNLATKRDLKEIEANLKRDLKEIEANLKRDIKELELKFNAQFVLLKWMMGVILAGIISLILKTFFIP